MKRNHQIISKKFAWFDVMLLLLAGLAASIDVMSYFKLGHVFTANMTGNTVLMGLSIGQGNLSASLHSMTALFGFIAGTFIGSIIVENKKRSGAFYIKLSIAIESLIILILTGLWFYKDQPMVNGTLYTCIVLSAIAMGMQSATVRHLKIPGVVTTFITGTITSIAMSIVNGVRQGFRKQKKNNIPIPVVKNLEQRTELQVMIFLVYGFTAAFAGWIEYHEAKFLPLLPLLFILCVLCISVTSTRHIFNSTE